MAMMLDAHRIQWREVSQDTDEVKARQKRTDEAPQPEGDRFLERIQCPACENDALVELEYEVEVSDGDIITTGQFVIALRCLFCGLFVNDYDELDFLRVEDDLRDQWAALWDHL
jgi:hypothetical protein